MPVRVEVSQSVVKTWRRCQAKYDYKYRQLLERKKPIVQLIRGTIIGECIDMLAQKRAAPKMKVNWESPIIKYEKQYRRLWDEEREYYGDIPGEVRRIMGRYQALYANDGLNYLHNSKSSQVYELPLEVDLVKIGIGKKVVFTGHMDKYPRDKQGRYWVMDHKSHKNIPDADARFQDLQLIQYFWAAPLSGYPKPTGVIWDYLRTKPPAIPEQLKDGGLSQRKNIDTDYETYLAEVKRFNLDEKNYPILKDLKARGQADFFQRVQLPGPNKALVQNVVEDLKATAIQIVQLGGKSKVRSIDRTCKQCEFFTLCQAEYRGHDANFIRKSEYQVQKTPRHDHSALDEE